MAKAPTIYVVTYNLDYEESAYSFRTRAEAVAHIAETFETDAANDTAAFWLEVFDKYSAGKWKGLGFYTLNLDTLVMKVAKNG